MRKSLKILYTFCVYFLVLLALSKPGYLDAKEIGSLLSNDYWPTKGWRTSTPEEQGMDSGKLADMFEEIKENSIGVDSVTIVRNGYIVTDAYLHPLFKPGMKHIIHSCTKSISSALIGIAIDKGYIKDVDQQVIGFFPDRKFANLDERKKAITLKHLLTMSHGIRSLDSWLYEWEGLYEMSASKDWVKYFLDQPMDVMPGVRYDYSNMGSFMLSAIIHKQTNTSTLSFARKNLFEPLGISDVIWPANSNGIQKGWGEMWLTPHDMAKIGWLYLNNGYWENRQIVSAKWVKDSTQKITSPKSFRKVIGKDGGLMVLRSIWSWIVYNYGWSISDGYGYQWWIDDSGIYSAVGYGGQYILVVPEKNMVVVFTSVLKDTHFSKPGLLLKEFIVPAVSSDKLISANPIELKRLKSLTKATDTSLKPNDEFNIPEMAHKISGRTYRLQDNPYKYTRFSLVFQPNKKIAYLKQQWGDNDFITIEIGLDNIYRVTEIEGKQVAMKGYWREKNTFTYSYNEIGATIRGIGNITFENNKVVYTFDEVTIGNIKLTAQAE